jgi:calcineurin-like phosphoesterase
MKVEIKNTNSIILLNGGNIYSNNRIWHLRNILKFLKEQTDEIRPAATKDQTDGSEM